MIENVPARVDSAFLYFHSACANSDELRPFMETLAAGLPNTYIWAGDGVISDTLQMYDEAGYGDSDVRFWFMMPMNDSSSPGSFATHAQAVGASLLSSGAWVNHLADTVRSRYQLSADRIVLSGFQHGSCVALSAAMMRRKDPFAKALLFQPFILESYYLEKERVQEETTVICVENQKMRQRTKHWINVETDEEFRKMGMVVESIVVDGDTEHLNKEMIDAGIEAIGY